MAIDLREFEKTATRIVEKARADGRLVDNPETAELAAILEREPGVRKTLYGNYSAQSEPTSRAAAYTKNSVDHDFGDDEVKLLEACERELSTQKLIVMDRVVGDRSSNRTVRLVIPESFAHVAFGGRSLFIKPLAPVTDPTYHIVFFYDDAFESNKAVPLAKKDITIRLAMLDDAKVIKIVRNSNYIGEYKKGVFAAEDWTSKTHGPGIFLHAGAREDRLQTAPVSYTHLRAHET